jgi:hypothetical protein
LYSRVDVSRVFGNFSCDVANKKKICYARLSSNHLQEKNQVKIFDGFYPETEIIKDIGSGLNIGKKSLYFFWTKFIQEKPKKLLSCTKKDYKDLVSDLSDSGLGPLKCAKRLLEGLWFTVKLTEVNKQSPVNSLKSCSLPLILLSKTIDSAVGTEKDDRNLKNAKTGRKNRQKKNHKGKSKNQQRKPKNWQGKAS